MISSILALYEQTVSSKFIINIRKTQEGYKRKNEDTTKYLIFSPFIHSLLNSS